MSVLDVSTCKVPMPFARCLLESSRIHSMQVQTCNTTILGNIMFYDLLPRFCFQWSCKLFNTTNRFVFIVIFRHPIPKCVTFLTIPYFWVLVDMQEAHTKLALFFNDEVLAFFQCKCLWIGVHNWCCKSC